jgi:hypothetical protein
VSAIAAAVVVAVIAAAVVVSSIVSAFVLLFILPLQTVSSVIDPASVYDVVSSTQSSSLMTGMRVFDEPVISVILLANVFV